MYCRTTQKAENTTQKTGNTTQKPISDTAQKIIDLLSEDPYLTRLDIALRLSLTPDGVRYHLNRLQKKGYLIRVEGPFTSRARLMTVRLSMMVASREPLVSISQTIKDRSLVRYKAQSSSWSRADTLSLR